MGDHGDRGTVRCCQSDKAVGCDDVDLCVFLEKPMFPDQSHGKSCLTIAALKLLILLK